jgi:hypothetical protein
MEIDSRALTGAKGEDHRPDDQSQRGACRIIIPIPTRLTALATR